MPAHRRHLKRLEIPGHARYLTCSCYRRLPLFNNDRIKDAFIDQLRRVHHRLAFELYAWVVMPEHFHLLIRPARTDADRKSTPGPSDQAGAPDDQNATSRRPATVTDVLRALKRPFAARVLDRWRALQAPALRRITDARGAAHFWQRGGGYDRNITTPHELNEKIHYIHDNPRRRGLVQHPADWHWSSWHEHEGERTAGPSIDPLPL